MQLEIFLCSYHVQICFQNEDIRADFKQFE